MMRREAVALVLAGLMGLACNALYSPAQCPEATPEPLWVEPVPATTDQASVIVEVHVGNGEQVTITAESGTFTAQGEFSTGNPARVEVSLSLGVMHHLEVTASIAEHRDSSGCRYGGYTLSTTSDKN